MKKALFLLALFLFVCGSLLLLAETDVWGKESVLETTAEAPPTETSVFGKESVLAMIAEEKQDLVTIDTDDNPASSVCYELDILPERFAQCVRGIDPKQMITLPDWVGIEGSFTDIGEMQTISLYLFCDTEPESSQVPCYYIFLDTGDGVSAMSFANYDISAISAVTVLDLTGDGLDEIVVVLSDGRTKSLYIITAMDNELRLLLSVSHSNRLADYQPDCGFSGTCDANMDVIIKNRYTGMEKTIDLTGFVRDTCLYDESTSFCDGEFSVYFELFMTDLLTVLDSGPEFITLDDGSIGISCEGLVRIKFNGKAYINECFASVKVSFSYDSKDTGFLISSTEIKQL